MKTLIYSFVSVTLSSTLLSLPKDVQVISGDVNMQVTSHMLEITASDKTIINYGSFDISASEMVRFLQPSSQSVVLNRITDGGKTSPSEILGNLEANGRVFLINPYGICFGENATINTNAFIASTLNIQDEDFLQGNYRFSLDKSAIHSKITNLGKITSSPEGFIAIMAPFIENRGSIVAQAGRVVLASAEKITLDFSGNGLIEFVVEGDLKESLIENYSNIESRGGKVNLSMKAAHQAIKRVVNTDGEEFAQDIQEINGVVRLIGTSSIYAENIDIATNAKLEITGTIDASNKKEGFSGGHIELFGQEIQLQKANISASGHSGGGVILIGGDYQGKGKDFNATNTSVDRDSVIFSDALVQGNGGKVIVWGDNMTIFDGNIFAKGSSQGKGGFVETSGKIQLGVTHGHVDTSSANGSYGQWLLDPSSVTIQTGGGTTIPTVCGDNAVVTIDPSVINGATSNVVICATYDSSSTIQINNNITMSNSGISLTFQTAGGTIRLPEVITTNRGPIIFDGPLFFSTGSFLDTTSSGSELLGADITFQSNVSSPDESLTIAAGTNGSVLFNNTVSELSSIIFSSAKEIQLAANFHTTSSQTFPSPVVLISDVTINFYGNISPRTLTFNSTVNGSKNLTFDLTNNGSVIFNGAVGDTTPLTNLAFTTASEIDIGANITTSGANNLIFSKPVSLTANSTISSGGKDITFSSTLDGIHDLTLVADAGKAIFNGVVGGSATLTKLAFTSASQIQVGANISTTANTLLFPCEVLLTGNSSITALYQDIIFNDKLNGNYNLSLSTRFSGVLKNLTFNDLVGNTFPLASLVTDAASTTVAQNMNIGSGGMTLTGDITLGGNIVSHSSQYYSGPSLTLTKSGGVSLTSNGSNISFETTPATLQNGVNLTVTTDGGEFSFNSITGNTSENILVQTGSGLASLGTISTGINNVEITSGSVILNGAITANAVTMTSSNAILNAGSPVDITSSGDVSLNSLFSDIGRLISPISINTSGELFAGAKEIAYLEGISVDDSVHEIPSNPPCGIVWNGVVIKECIKPPVPPITPEEALIEKYNKYKTVSVIK